ncbi:MAG: isoprenyl transferase [Xanthomonadales bacterium]|nr:isoprenyl transferase [Xanthomonadales bacterium]
MRSSLRRNRNSLKSERDPLPRHIAIVMDGNGRWAQKRKRPRTFGHQAGQKSLRQIVEHCGQIGVPELTVFAFSSENWNRPRQEVSRLMELFLRALDKEARELDENDVRIRFIGDSGAFTPELQEKMTQAQARTSKNQHMKLNVAVNYGGRWDIVQASRAIAAEAAAGRLSPERIDEAIFNRYTALPQSPDPDLFIRTGGEMRVSNFLLWQCAYTEYYFSPALWPDFSPAHLDAAIAEFQRRERRFGMTGEQARIEAG